MRIALFVALAIAAATPAAAQNASQPPAYANAEACLRDKVADAVRVSSGATDAADFLVKYLCGGPVGAASAWERNTAYLASMKAMMSGMAPSPASDAEVSIIPPPTGPMAEGDAVDLAAALDWTRGVSVDPVSGQFVLDGSNPSAAAISLADLGASSDFGPVFLRELAGRLVVENRR